MIETARLLIRRFEEEDYPSLFEYFSNPKIYEFEPGEPVTMEEAKELTCERCHRDDYWAITLKSTHKLIGHLYFRQIEPKEISTWELCYIINPAFHHKGYATESASALLRYAFDQFGIHRVVASCNPKNVASWKVLERIGMRREGKLRKSIFIRRDENGNPLWTDSLVYGILREETPFA
jgi:ribosomal-protein-alanine N-acetyltransferase